VPLLSEDVEVVSLERMTRFYLLNHFLFKKAERRDIVDVDGNVCGLHSQLPLTPYSSLWNRVKDFEPQQLDETLYQEKNLVKTWFMRGTLHVIPSKDVPIYHNALKRMWFEHHGRYMNTPDWPNREQREKLIYPKILEALAQKPLRRKELNDKTKFLLDDASQPYARLFSAWGGILKETSYMGLTVHAQPCGKESCFARLDQWLPNISLGEIDEDQARNELLLKYLRCYGPASAQDFACWSGLLTSEAARAIESNLTALKPVQIKETGRRLWMIGKDFKTLLKLDLEEETLPCLLPKFDSYLMGHKDRTRIIEDRFLKQVYRPVVGDVAATVLVNGRIVGTWTSKKTKKALTVAVKAFRKPSKSTLSELKQAAKELGAFMGIEHTGILLTD
jgi:uncharacterized protein YcaQ